MPWLAPVASCIALLITVPGALAAQQSGFQSDRFGLRTKESYKLLKTALGRFRSSALEASRQLRERGMIVDLHEYERLMTRMANRGTWQEALEIWEHFLADNGSPSLKLSTAAISAYGHGGLWDHALALLDALPEKNIEIDTVCLASAVGACRDQWQLAVQILDNMVNKMKIAPDLRTYNTVMHSMELAEEYLRCEDLLYEMRFWGIGFDRYTLCSVMHTAGKASRWERAVSLLDFMLVEKVEVDAFAFKTAIRACGIGKQWEAAMSVMEDAKGFRLTEGRIQRPLHKRHHGADISTYNTLLEALAGTRQFLQAGLVMDDLLNSERFKPTSWTYTAFLSACQDGEWQVALSSLEGMAIAGFEPSRRDLEHALQACLAASKEEVAEELRHRLDDLGSDSH